MVGGNNITPRSRTASEGSHASVSPDPVDWVEQWWSKSGAAGAEQFLAMTSIMRVHQLMTDAISLVLKPFDLTVNAYFLLETVQLSKEGKLLLSHLAKRIMVHPTTVTLLTDRLEEQGLVVREPHQSDRRATFARLTPAGKALANEATRALADIDFGVPKLNASEARQLVTLLRPVRAELGDFSRSA